MSKARLTTGSLSRAACKRGSSSIARTERDGIERVLRHQLAQLVDLAIGHLQHAADVAQHAARLQRAESDDLRYAIAAVTLLHVADDFVAAILAEIDIEVGHRYALRIEEALEQQPEANRIEISDGQRIGHERSRARAAAGPDRNALRLRPLDEIGDDQEIAGIFHALDDFELERQSFAIVLDGAAAGELPESRIRRSRPACARLRNSAASSTSAPPLADRKARQDRRLNARTESASLRDLDGRRRSPREHPKTRPSSPHGS